MFTPLFPFVGAGCPALLACNERDLKNAVPKTNDFRNLGLCRALREPELTFSEVQRLPSLRQKSRGGDFAVERMFSVLRAL